MLHFKHTSNDSSLSDIHAQCGHRTIPPGALDAGTGKVSNTMGISLSIDEISNSCC